MPTTTRRFQDANTVPDHGCPWLNMPEHAPMTRMYVPGSARTYITRGAPMTRTYVPDSARM
eukprot:1180427-Prorocentrum_minimum.AAC.2